jgi:hypothetical protein
LAKRAQGPLADLGVSAWHKFAGHEDENGNYWTRDIGYVKVGTEWGIALRKTPGNEFSERHDEDVWPFKDAPRWMQVDSVSKIPDFFEELIKRTDETVKKLQAKSLQAKELSEALNAAIADLSCNGPRYSPCSSQIVLRPVSQVAGRLSLLRDHFRTVLAVKGSLRRAYRRALDRSGPFSTPFLP